MSPENNKFLIDSYPKIFSKVRYCSTGDGWFAIINNVCNQIQEYLDQNPSVPQFTAVQIKEKFGTLRFYGKGGDNYCYSLIDQAEQSSEKTCDVCGANGELRNDRAWLRTLCDDHA